MTIAKHLNIKEMLRSGTQLSFDSRLSFKSYVYLTTSWPSFIFWPEPMTHNGGSLILWITWQHLLLKSLIRKDTKQEWEERKKKEAETIRTVTSYEVCFEIKHVKSKINSVASSMCKSYIKLKLPKLFKIQITRMPKNTNSDLDIYYDNWNKNGKFKKLT